MSLPNELLPVGLLAGGAVGPTQYRISRSLRFNSPDSAYLSRTPSQAGNRKTWTWAGWVKRSAIGTGDIAQYLFDAGSEAPFRFNLGGTADQLEVRGDQSGLTTYSLLTTQVFRDPSAWLHLVVAFDTTQSTASNRIKIYVNGSQITAFASATYPDLNGDYAINGTTSHAIGRYAAGGGRHFSGYLADIHFIDGQALTPSSFGQFDSNGVWQPKAYTGTYGTNGFRLDFADNSAATAAALGKDTSGNGNNWTPTNLSVTAGAGNDSLVDTPTNYGTDTGAGGEVRGNYATLNPLYKGTNSSFANGNLNGSVNGTSGNWYVIPSNFAVSSGKWFAEATYTAVGGSGASGVGIASLADNLSGYFFPGYTAASYGYHNNAYRYNNSSGAVYGASWTTGDVIGIALDLDAGTIAFYKNGVSQGQAYSGIPANSYYFIFGGATSTNTFDVNFGQRPFAYAAPSGYKALCTQNLPTPTIPNGRTAMDVVTYTGNGSTQTISGLGFGPDLVWIKCRSVARNHALQDVVRGALQWLGPNLTNAESTDSNSITSFNSDGFSLGNATGYNQSGETHVAWAWDAGTTTVSNTSGSITSQVRANASAGISIVSYTTPSSGGPWTVGHGLGASPSLIITKPRSNTGNWIIYHASLGNTGYLLFNTDAFATQSQTWNNTSPSSTVFTQGTTAWWGASYSYIAYCFAPVAGFSAFGSYTGNGSADGPFVWTGMRPRWIMIKCSSTNNGYTFWDINDTARSDYNVLSRTLCANLSDAEDSANIGNQSIDILSNGFKIRTTGSSKNLSNQTYIYAAFAENPFSLNVRAR